MLCVELREMFLSLISFLLISSLIIIHLIVCKKEQIILIVSSPHISAFSLAEALQLIMLLCVGYYVGMFAFINGDAMFHACWILSAFPALSKAKLRSESSF